MSNDKLFFHSYPTQNRSVKNHPAARGAFLALLAALLFGASTPLVQRVGVDVSGWMTATMLYAGAAVAGFLLRSRCYQKKPPCGDGTGRAFCSWRCLARCLARRLWHGGLQHTGGMSASLMLTQEAVFTVLLSFLLYREHIGRRVGLAIVFLMCGSVLLVFDRAANGAPQVIGLLAVMAATVSWGVDNTLSRALADIDPGRVVLGKATVGAACSFLIAAATSGTMLSWDAGADLFLIGATGYGLSLRFYLLAQRAFGATRTGSVFAIAPFIGAVIAFGLGERGFSPWMFGGRGLNVGRGRAAHHRTARTQARA